MKILSTAILAALLTLGACGGPPDDVETNTSAIYQTVPSTIHSLNTYSCGGYTYRMVATWQQLWNGSTYADVIGDSSANINGTVAGGTDVYLTCNVGPGTPPTAYGFSMNFNLDAYHLKNEAGFYCKLEVQRGGLRPPLDTTIAVDGVYYTSYPFSAYQRGELLLHLKNAVAGQVPQPGSGYCGPQYLLMQL